MQRIKHQHIENLTKQVSGLIYAPLIQMYVTPWFILETGVPMTWWNGVRLTVVFMCISYLVMMCIRKYFNSLTAKEYAHLKDQKSAYPVGKEESRVFVCRKQHCPDKDCPDCGFGRTHDVAPKGLDS